MLQLGFITALLNRLSKLLGPCRKAKENGPKSAFGLLDSWGSPSQDGPAWCTTTNTPCQGLQGRRTVQESDTPVDSVVFLEIEALVLCVRKPALLERCCFMLFCRGEDIYDIWFGWSPFGFSLSFQHCATCCPTLQNELPKTQHADSMKPARALAGPRFLCEISI